MESANRGEQTREQIVQAAYQLFLDRGYHATSMRQVAGQAGIALGGIYNHFPSKEELFSAVLEAYHPYREIIPALATAEGDTIEGLTRDFAARITDTLRRRPDFLNLMFVEIVEFKGRHIPDLIEEILPQLVEIFQRYGERSAELRDIPLPVIIRAFVGLFLSYAITEVVFTPAVASQFPENTMDLLVEILLHGIMRSEIVPAPAGGAA